jgi:hypothetical protein
MEPYNEDAAVKYNKINSNEDWLRKRQGLALPALPPTTPEARKYFFYKVRHFAALASENGLGKINYEAFAQEWNQSADGVVRFYVTVVNDLIYASNNFLLLPFFSFFSSFSFLGYPLYLGENQQHHPKVKMCKNQHNAHTI